MSALLEVAGLSIGSGGGRGPARPLVHDVSFSLARGESLGLVGESGSGKSLTLRSVLDLLPTGVHRTAGRIETRARVGMVFQDPLGALDPLMPIGAQLVEVLRTAVGLDRRAARVRALELLDLVSLPEPARRFGHYPHQLSGGQRQRVVIAIALAGDPEVLLCDEPTTALDVTVQARILDLLRRLRDELGVGIVLVSHDLAVVGALCERVIVLREGRVVEQGPLLRVVREPAHPYTRQLVDAVLAVPPLAPAPHARQGAGS